MDHDSMTTTSKIKEEGIQLDRDDQTVTCSARLQWELRPDYPLFSLEEPSGERVDVKACFAPRHPVKILLRMLFLGWSVQVFYKDIQTYPRHNLYIYMGYLTHWAHALSICYFFTSVVCMVIPNVSRQPPVGEEPRRLVKITWSLYGIVAPLEVAVIMYWSAPGKVINIYVACFEHGVLACLILMDGLWIGHVPVRAKHVIFMLVLCISYLLWTLVNAALGIGGGEWGPAYDDDALYPALRWKSETRTAASLSAFAICVLAPLVFCGCWLLSLASCKTRHCCCCCNCTWTGARRPIYVEKAVDMPDQECGYKAVLDEAIPV